MTSPPAHGPQRATVGVRDLLREAIASVTISPLRSALAGLGVAVAAAALVVTSGISATLSRQVSAEFDAVRATEVLVSVADGKQPTAWTRQSDLARVRRLPGVLGAGVMLPPSSFAVGRPPADTVREVRIRPVDAEFVRILEPRIIVGRSFDSYHVTSGSPVVMLSRTVAASLGVTRPSAVVDAAGRRLTVIGVYDDVQRRQEVLLEALVPLSVELPADQPADSPTAQVLVETEPGAAGAVAETTPLALHPEAPRALLPSSPLDPTQFRRGIEQNIAALSFGVILVCLLLGTLSIASTATASVHTRTTEIGLRSVVGARPTHIFAQLVLETLAIGLAGGAAGVSLGLLALMAACIWNGWLPVFAFGYIGIALTAGAGAGLLAGVFPAWRAMRIEPVDALRH